MRKQNPFQLDQSVDFPILRDHLEDGARTMEGPKMSSAALVNQNTVVRRRVNVYPRPPTGIRIEIDLPSNEANEFLGRARAKKRKTSDLILEAVDEITGTGEKRERRGYVQPQVPKTLRDRFKSVAKQGGSGGGAAYLRDYLEHWIDPETGKRRLSPRRRYIRPKRSDEFVARGRELIKRAQSGTDGESLVRYTFDAGESKPGLMKLIRAMNISLSEFFSALIERGCADWEEEHPNEKEDAGAI
jgi:hypothetical protein